jgi:hypothetical protein
MRACALMSQSAFPHCKPFFSEQHPESVTSYDLHLNMFVHMLSGQAYFIIKRSNATSFLVEQNSSSLEQSHNPKIDASVFQLVRLDIEHNYSLEYVDFFPRVNFWC